MAGVTIATVPMILVFLSAQRYFVSGIAMTGIKG
jgi:multiple sugar transport system permease protein